MNRIRTFVLAMVVGFTGWGSSPAQAQGIAIEQADFDGSGRVDFADLVQFAGAYGKSQGDPAYDVKFDFNASGTVDFQDFIAFAGTFGRSVGSGASDVFLYVSDFARDRVDAINIATNLAVPSRGFNVTLPRGMTYVAAQQTMYVATLDSLLGFNANGQRTVGFELTKIDDGFSGLQGPGGSKVVVSSDGSRAYVTETEAAVVEVIDLLQLSSVGRIPVGANPLEMAFSADGSEIYLGHSGIPSAPISAIYVLGTASLTVADSIHVGPLATGRIAASPSGHRVYAVTGTVDESHVTGVRHQLMAIDPVSRTVIDSVQISHPDDTFATVIDVKASPAGDRAYISVMRGVPTTIDGLLVTSIRGEVIAVNTSSFDVGNEYLIGEQVGLFGISPDGQTLYVSGVTSFVADPTLRIFVLDTITGQSNAQLPLAILSASEFEFVGTKPAARNRLPEMLTIFP